MVGKGQPPKKPEDVRKNTQIRFSQTECEKIESGIKAEETKEKFSTYVRNAALRRAEEAIKKKEI